MTELGKTLEIDECRLLAIKILAQSAEDATKYVALGAHGKLTDQVGRSSVQFWVGMDRENVRDRNWWCTVAGDMFDPDEIRLAMIDNFEKKKIINAPDFRVYPINEEKIIDGTEHDVADFDLIFDLYEIDDEAENDISDESW